VRHYASGLHLSLSPLSALLAIGALALGLVLVVAGANLFFDGLLASAAYLRLSPFVLTAVISGFELENLVAGIVADLGGFPDAAAGTFLGGTTFLALGVAGLAAVVSPIEADLPRPVFAWAAAAPLPLGALALDGELSRLDGGLLTAWFAVALAGIVRAGWTLGAGELPRRRRRFLPLLGGLAVLTAGGWVFGDGIRRTVVGLGMPESLLGNTAVAASVEAEEVARVSVPARRGRGDVAVANLVGTFVHFIAFNAGVIALIRPLELDDVSIALHLPVAVASPILLAALLAWRHRLTRVDGIVLLALYAAYVAAAIIVAVAR
jgi:cation:H+ antiporter